MRRSSYDFRGAFGILILLKNLPFMLEVAEAFLRSLERIIY